MVTATVENVTVPGDVVHWGDTVRVTTSGMPSGRNYATIATYGDFYQKGIPYTERVTFRGEATGDEVLFAVGHIGVYPPGVESVTAYVWLDNDADLSNGVVPGGMLDPFVVLPPR